MHVAKTVTPRLETKHGVPCCPEEHAVLTNSACCVGKKCTRNFMSARSFSNDLKLSVFEIRS